jgi:hypothetical protein
MSPQRYLFNLLVALDQLLNTLLAGLPDETLSSRANKAMIKSARTGKRWGCILCGLLDRIDPGHCGRAVEWDEN